MDTLTLTEPKVIKIEASNFDPKLAEEEVLVEVDRISLCGSDYKLFNGSYSGPSIYPLRFGHEWSGQAIETGPGVKRINKGDRVTGDCSIWCGSCPNCSVDKNLCRNIEKYGITKDGFSQQLKVVREKYLYRAPSLLPYSVLALTEPFAVALHAIHLLSKNPQPPSEGKTLVIGCGPIGLAIYILLKHYYRWVDLEIYDVVPERIALLQKLFPNDEIKCFINHKNELIEQRNYTELYASADYSLIFEATGKIEALKLAIDLVKPRGSIISLGMFSSDMLDFGKIVLKAIRIIGSIGGTGEFAEVIKFFEKNLDIIKPLVTAVYPYTDAEKAFNDGQNLKQNIKVQIKLSNGGKPE